MAVNEYYIDCAGTPIHAKLEMPEGNPQKCPLYIVVPGLTGHMEEEHIIAAAQTLVSCGYAALRVELYGHGKSGGAFYDHNMLLWVSELVTIIDHARKLPFVTEVNLMGHSQGGAAVILAAGIINDVVAHLIPLAPAFNIKDLTYGEHIYGTVPDPEHLPETLYLFGEDPISSNYLRVNLLLPFEAAVDAYKGPVMLIHGTGDLSVPCIYSRQLKERYADAHLTEIPEAPHCYDDHLEELCSAIREFLRRE